MLALSLATFGLSSCGDSEPPVAARAGEVVISQPYALNAPLADSLPVYLTVINQGGEADTLVGASSPAGGEVLLVLGGRRSPVSPDSPLALPADGEVKFTPEGDHLLLLDALPRLSDGDVFSLDTHLHDRRERGCPGPGGDSAGLAAARTMTIITPL